MEMYQLKTFVAVAQEGHLTRASESLHLSQPAVSAHIKSLEDELGILLFGRTPKGMQLTPAGKLLLKQAENALAATRDLYTQAKLLKDEISGTIQLGTIADPLSMKMGEFLQMAAACYPQITFHLMHGISGTIVNGIKKRKLDAGYILGTNEDEDIAALRLKNVRLYVTAPVAWKDRIEKTGWSEIASLPWIVTPPVCIINQLPEVLPLQRKSKPYDYSSHEISLEKIMAAGLGLSILREDQAVAAEQAGEVILWRQLHCETPISLLYLKERKSDPIIKAMVSVAKQVWGNSVETG
jgi:DNA-binding transcriptional LysR family regulator